MMKHTLQIKAFFFNAKTDYLPYYKSFQFNVEGEMPIETLLALIKEENFAFAYPEDKLLVKINGLIVEAKEPIATIVEKLGNQLTLEPAKSYRSMHGLIINDDDFMQAYKLLEPYATPSDFKYYQTLYALHYASETEHFDHAYIGDAILVLAHKMISEGNTHKKEILHAISSVHSGLFDCEYENNLFHAQSHDAAITALKDMLTQKDTTHPSLFEILSKRFFKEKKTEQYRPKKSKRRAKSIENLQDKHIAYYAGIHENNHTLISKLIQNIGTKEISFTRKYKRMGVSILYDNQALAFKKAGTTLLDAYDSGAEVLIIEDPNAYEMIEKYFSNIEDTIGRKMHGLEYILVEDFIAQANTLQTS